MDAGAALFQQYSMVRVSRLMRPPEDYDGWGVNQQPPRLGDVGTVVEILEAAGYPHKYVVEAADPNGATVWLAEFYAEELEPFA